MTPSRPRPHPVRRAQLGLQGLLGHLSITPKLTLVLLAVGLTPLLASQFLALQQFKRSLVLNRLEQAEEVGANTLADLQSSLALQSRPPATGGPALGDGAAPNRSAGSLPTLAAIADSGLLENQKLGLGRSGRAQLMRQERPGSMARLLPLVAKGQGTQDQDQAVRFEPLSISPLEKPNLLQGNKRAGNVIEADGVRRVGVWLPLEPDNTGLLISVERQEVLQSAVNLRDQLIALSLLTTAAVAGAGVLLGRSLTRPLRDLHNAVQGFDAASEDALQTVAVQGNDEIGTLARTFNRMTRRIQDRSATLNSTNNRIQAYIQTVQTALLAIGMNGEITLLNEVGCQLLGFPPARWLGANWLNDCMVDAEARRILRDALERARQGEAMGRGEGSKAASRNDVSALGEAAVLDYHVRSQDGRILLMRWHSSLLRGESGQVIGLLSSGEDITLRRSQELELIEARRVAEQANAAKSEFLSRMSHELRTPMNAIIGMSYLALRANPEPRLQDYVSKINAAGQKLLALINDILDFSKIEAGKMSLERTDFLLDSVLADLSTLIAQKIFDQGLELLFLVDEDVPRQLQGDPLRLGQVLLNLLSNASKFTKLGQIVLRISCLEQRGQRVQLRFEVTDTGIGMEESQLAKLFQPFEQAELSTTRHFGGSGLGLTICRHLLGLMEGTIEASSAVGEGSTFRATAWFGLGAGLPAAVLPEQLKNLRVLLVDDNPIALEVLMAHLAHLPLQLSCCGSGEETLQQVRRAAESGAPIDLVLLDWQLPGMDGLETMRQLRQRESEGAPEVVMVTAFGRDDVRFSAEREGIRAFLTKPVCQSELLDILVTLEQPDPRSPLPLPPSPLEMAQQEGLAGLRVLLVEDNEINQQICCELLRDASVEVTVAADGAEALQRLEQPGVPADEGLLPFDLVLMDLNMPVLDGWETTRRIREDSRWDRLPVLAMTAHALVEERDRCQALGMQDHLTKPIEPDTLFQALRRWGRPGEPSSQNATQSDAATPVYGDLPGFDLTGGLRRTAGNLALHRQLLNSLANTQASASRRVQEALNSNDTLEAQRIAHTVKGVAANLGATALAEAAGQLDRALQSDGSWQEPLVHFDRTLRQSVATIRSLQAAAKEPSPRPAAASTGREPGPADLERLATLLAAGDGDALELFRRLQPDLATLLGEAAVAAMAAHLERFALEAAHRELVVARQAMANRQPSPEQSRL